MPLIILGVVILIAALVIIPLIVFLFTNPIAFGVSLIAIGILWMLVPKLFHTLTATIFNILKVFSEDVFPKFESKIWPKSINTKVKAVIDSDLFARIFIYGLIGIGIIIVIYFEYIQS
ncbi:hypothetical protein [Acinetobacter nosocomialis]|uniref:hypothetical protein n=1 Tax=Acinetobacter nosocomialis TaxID=106654 RepID=UPI00124FFC97|nr:hypothetical protein [Acinetobacter nosocomialis]